jgi:hypothetical protein
MKSDIQISLEPSNLSYGAPEKLSSLKELLKSVAVGGASINYGINKVPTASVRLVPANPSVGFQEANLLFCDFDKAKRQPVKLVINSEKNCIVFEGIIDGCSISQQPGSMSATLMLKHRYILLNEVYPRGLGWNAGTCNIFAIPTGLEVDGSFNLVTSNTPGVLELVSSIDYVAGNVKVLDQQIDMTKYAIPLIVDVFKAIVKGQHAAKSTSVQVTDQYRNSENANVFQALISAVGLNAQNLYQPVIDCLDGIVTGHAEGLKLPGTDVRVALNISNHLATLEDTLLTGLIKILSDFGCVLVIGNDSAFAVPQANYLKITDEYQNDVDSIAYKLTSTTPNIAYPADYLDFTFHDAGENTIKGVYITPEPLTSHGPLISEEVNRTFGFYTEDLNVPNTHNVFEASSGWDPSNKNSVYGNIVVKTLPNIAASYLGPAAFWATKDLRADIENGKNSFAPDDALEVDEIYDEITATQQELELLDHQVGIYMNNLAQIEYSRLKYGGRTGNISLPFNNNWVPGAVGRLYTRSPGMLIDFYVTDVSHNFELHVANSGSATTTVNFDGGRTYSTASTLQTGLDKIDLYDYTYNTGAHNSMLFCASFLGDISTSA